MPQIGHPAVHVSGVTGGSGLGSDLCRAAVVLPITQGMRAGVVVDGNVVGSSLLYRRYGPSAEETEIIGAGAPARPEEAVDEDVIFAGYLFGQYGHFLLESLSRLWFARERPDLPIVWCGWRRPRRPPYEPWQAEILRLLGVANRPMVVERPTRFRSVIIPEPGYVIRDVFHPAHAQFLGAVAPEALVSGRRCWVSRAELPRTHGGVHNERVLEETLRAHGWVIFHPERHTVAGQLACLSASETIAGIAGSAFHTLILLSRLESDVRLVMARGPRNVNYETIAAVKGFRQSITTVEARVYAAGAIASQNRMIVQNFNEVLDNLDVPRRPPAGRERGRSRAEAVARIATASQVSRYVAIGLADGTTFRMLATRDGVAVEPGVGLDARSLDGVPDEGYYQMSADEYFTRFADGRTFDLMLLASPMALEDVLRAFFASLPFASPRAVWVLDHDEWLVGSEPARKRRTVEWSRRGPPQGDAETVPTRFLLAVHDLLPMLDYATFEGDGYRLSVLWQGLRREFAPLGVGLAQMSGRPERDLIGDADILHVRPEGEVLASLATYTDPAATDA